MQKILKNLKSLAIGLLALAFFTATTVTSCSSQNQKAEDTENVEDASTEESSGDEHPSSDGEHPSSGEEPAMEDNEADTMATEEMMESDTTQMME